MQFDENRNIWREISGIIVCDRSTVYLDSLIEKVKDYRMKMRIPTPKESDRSDRKSKKKKATVKELLSQAPVGAKQVKKRETLIAPSSKETLGLGGINQESLGNLSGQEFGTEGGKSGAADLNI